MQDYFELGPTPSGEDCQQVGMDNYDAIKARQECKAFINQLKRVFGEPPVGGFFKVKSCPHDFGTYQEVFLYFEKHETDDDDNEEEILTLSEQYAYNIEANIPEYWDEEAKKELGIPQVGSL